MQDDQLLPHLFRTEYRKIVSVLCRYFGLGRMELAEDLASDTFLTAAETWSIRGLPENPVAWLYTVAKNRAKDQLKRDMLFEQKMAPALADAEALAAEPEIDLSDQNITDSQLQMMFAICHPALTTESQIGLALRILCGFGIGEIADAFLASKETINKRLFRAKEKLRTEKVKIEFPPPSAIGPRLSAVLKTLYLLFNEGYYSRSGNTSLRKELCMEAMRLNYLLLENEQTNLPEVNALLSLMCFHASRFEARTGPGGEMIRYDDQDTSLWNEDLISKGKYYLEKTSAASEPGKYAIEAAIAYWHTIKEESTGKWETILKLYDRLLLIEYSPVAALNRTFALAKVKGKHGAIMEAEQLQLEEDHLYHVLLGYLYTGLDEQQARKHLEKALALAKSPAEKKRIKSDLKLLN